MSWSLGLRVEIGDHPKGRKGKKRHRERWWFKLKVYNVATYIWINISTWATAHLPLP